MILEEEGKQYKYCGTCHQKLLIDNFYKYKNSCDGYQWQCKDCARERIRQTRKNKYVKVGKETLADCAIKCLKEEGLTGFYTNNYELMHKIYDAYKNSPKSRYRFLKNKHPMNILSAVRIALQKDSRFEYIPYFASYYALIKLIESEE